MNEKKITGVIIDAGHGGSDPGAINGNVYEKDFNLKASKYMYDRLRELGIPAQLTRDTDISLPKDERIAKVKSLYGNDPNVILVSNHINSGGGDGQSVTNKCITIKAKYRNKWIINHKKQLIYKLL